eukprot:scaffold6259_cov122-Isochrysis_galbana.AAC.2
MTGEVAESAEKLNDYIHSPADRELRVWEMHMHKFGWGTLAQQKQWFYAEYGVDPVPVWCTTPCDETADCMLHAASARTPK